MLGNFGKGLNSSLALPLTQALAQAFAPAWLRPSCIFRAMASFRLSANRDMFPSYRISGMIPGFASGFLTKPSCDPICVNVL